MATTVLELVGLAFIVAGAYVWAGLALALVVLGVACLTTSALVTRAKARTRAAL